MVVITFIMTINHKIESTCPLTQRSYLYLWLIHVDVWQKPTQLCKAFILQFKNN